MMDTQLLSRTMLYKPMMGAGGGGKKSGGSTAPTRTPDTLRSADSVEILLGIGEGEIGGLVNGAKSFYVGDTVLQNSDNSYNFEYFELEVRPGLPEGTADQVKPRLGGVSQNIAVNTGLSYNTPVVRQMSQNNIDAIDVRLNVQALYRQDDNGIYEHQLNLNIEIKKDTDSVWLPAFANLTLPIRGKTTSTYVKEFRIPVQRTNDFWQVRITKMSTNTNTTQATDVLWDSIQMISHDLKKYPDTATARIFAKATNQFSSIPEFSGIYKGRLVRIPTNYNPDTRQYTEPWNGTFTTAYTDNPAWIVYDFVTNSRYGMSSAIPLTMDKYEVYLVAKWCDTMVSNGAGGFRPRYTFNGLISEAASAIETARYIAGTFNATLFDDGNGTIIMRADMNQAATHLFTPENVTEDGFSYSFTDINSRYNDITMSFLNKDLLYVEDRRRIADEAHIAEFGRIPVDLIAVGCTDPVEVIARGRYKLITSTTEKQLVTFKTNRIGAIVEPYEVVLVADPLAGYALTGRVKSLNAGRTQVTLRDPLYLEVGVSYVMQFRGVGGLSAEYTVTVPSSGSVTQFNVSPALPSDIPEFATFYLSQPGGVGIGAPKPFRVMKVDELADDPDHIQIVAHEINRNKFTDAETGITSPAIKYSSLGDPSAIPGPTNVTFTEKFNFNGSEVWTILTVTLDRSKYRYYTGDYEVWSRPLDGSNNPIGSFVKRELKYDDTIINHPPGLHEFKILPKNSLGQTPPIGSVLSWNHVVGSAASVGTPPNPVTSVVYTLTPTGFIVRWTPPAGQEAQIHHYMIKEGLTEGTATILANEVKDPVFVLDPMIKRTYNLYIYAVSVAQVPSTAVNVSITNSAPAVPSNIRVEVGYENVMVFFDRNTEIDIVGYRIQFRKVGDQTWLDMDPSGIFDQGEPDTAYEFRIAALDALSLLLDDFVWSLPRSVRTRNTIGVEQGLDDVRASTTQNLVRNGSFERGIQNWVFDASTVEDDASAPYVDPVTHSTKIARVGNGTSSEGSIASDKFVVRMNQYYALSGDFRRYAADPGESHVFTMRIYDQNQVLLKDYSEDEGKLFIDPNMLDSTAFSRLSTKFFIPNGGVFADVFVQSRGAGILEVDGIQCQRGSTATAFNPHVAEELSPEDLGIITNPDATAPGPVTGLAASAGFRTVTLTYTPPADTDVDHYDVFRNVVNDFTSATLVGDSISGVYADSGIMTGVTYYYWVRVQDRAGNKSTVTGPVSAMTLQLSAADFQDLSIVNAKIANAAIDDAKIASVSAGKLTAGTITAGLIFLGSANFLLTGQGRYLGVADDNGFTRVLIGRLGSGAANYGIQVYSQTGKLILGADGLGVSIVGTTNIEDNAVTNAKVVSGAIDVDKLAANSVIASKIAASAVETAKLAAGAVTADKISVAQLSAISANLGTIVAGKLQAEGLSADYNYWNLDTGAFAIGTTDGSKYLRFNPATGELEIRAKITATNAQPVQWLDVEGRPTTLTGLNATEGNKLGSIAYGADVTAENTALNTANLGGISTAQAVANLLDPAAVINQTATEIDGNKIVTGSITANKINVATLSALSANIGTIVAGFLRNGANTAYVNLDASGGQPFLYAGNGAFYVTAAGQLYAQSGSITGDMIVGGTITAAQIIGNGITDLIDVTDGFATMVAPGEKWMVFMDVATYGSGNVTLNANYSPRWILAIDAGDHILNDFNNVNYVPGSPLSSQVMYVSASGTSQSVKGFVQYGIFPFYPPAGYNTFKVYEHGNSYWDYLGWSGAYSWGKYLHARIRILRLKR